MAHCPVLVVCRAQRRVCAGAPALKVRQAVGDSIDALQQSERAARSPFLADFLLQETSSNAVPISRRVDRGATPSAVSGAQPRFDLYCIRLVCEKGVVEDQGASESVGSIRCGGVRGNQVETYQRIISVPTFWHGFKSQKLPFRLCDTYRECSTCFW